MLSVVVENVAFDPAGVSFFRADGVVFEADGITDPIEQCSRSWFHRGFPPVQVDFFWIALYNTSTRPPGTFRKRAGNRVIIHTVSANATLRAD